MKTAHIQVVFNSDSDQALKEFQKDIAEHAKTCGGTIIQNIDRLSTVRELNSACSKGGDHT